MAAAASRVSRGRNDDCGFGEVKVGSRVPFIGAIWRLGVRAQGGRGGARGRVGLELVSGSVGGGRRSRQAGPAWR